MNYSKIPILESGQPDWENISNERLKLSLITLDGKGMEFKTKALDELLNRARSEGMDSMRDAVCGRIG